jgi:hypothetical protein
MESKNASISEVIAEEAACYLSVVALFRNLGCEPHWRPEPQAIPRAPRRAATDRRNP